MKLSVRLTAAAEQDLLLAHLWYAEEAPHMIEALVEELRQSYQRISDTPKFYQEARAYCASCSASAISFLYLLPHPDHSDRSHRRAAPSERSSHLERANISSPS